MDEFKWNNDDFQNNVNQNQSNENPEIYTENDSNEEFTSNAYTPVATAQEIPKKKKAKKFGTNVLVASIIVTMIVSVSGYAALKPVVDNFKNNAKSNTVLFEEDNKTDSKSNVTAKNVAKTSDGEKMEIPDIAEKVGPAVVGVINKTTYSGNGYGYYYPYQQQQQSQEVEQGSGSGILISSDGYIVTNQHVIDGATSISVVLSTGKEYNATLKGSDTRTDLALLKIEGEEFPYATFGDSTKLRVGDLCVAIGNPLGQELAGTVTVGYISALNRSITIDNKTLTLLQTDAAINPGNSGGALVNEYGEVIGINTAKISSSNLEGLGFAIPTSEAKPILNDLMQSGYVKGRPVIGFAGRAISAQDAKRYNLVEGIYVYSMTSNSPAYVSGLKIGDIVVECEGQKVTTVDELNTIKNKHKPNDTIKLKVWRSGSYMDISLVLGEDIPQ